MRWISGLILVLLAASLSACGPSISTKRVGFSVAREANDRSPVPVELVVVYDVEVLPVLLELSAREWFAARGQMLLDHPRAVRTQLWELVPGQEVPLQQLPVPRKGAIAAFVYADYLMPGPHRIRIDPYARALIHLTEESMVLAPAR